VAEERVQKILARAGYGSRRSCEELIRQNRVSVNGNIISLGDKADASTDDIRVDSQKIELPTEFAYVILNKPAGVISDEDVGKRYQSARELIPIEGHLFPVGRLDLDSEGLMIFTNDGELAHKLTHPRFEHTKVYLVVVEGVPSQEVLDRWSHGIELLGKKTLPARVEVIDSRPEGTHLAVTLREGRKRQIRRVAAQLGHPVVSLKRVQIGPVRLGDLPEGGWRHLTEEEVQKLQKVRDSRRRSKTAKSSNKTGEREHTRNVKGNEHR